MIFSYQKLIREFESRVQREAQPDDARQHQLPFERENDSDESNRPELIGCLDGRIAAARPTGLASANQLDLHDILFGASTTEGYTANQAGTGGTLTVSDGTHTANIVILGQYSEAGFTKSVDNGGGTLVTYHDPHSLV